MLSDSVRQVMFEIRQVEVVKAWADGAPQNHNGRTFEESICLGRSWHGRLRARSRDRDRGGGRGIAGAFCGGLSRHQANRERTMETVSGSGRIDCYDFKRGNADRRFGRGGDICPFGSQLENYPRAPIPISI